MLPESIEDRSVLDLLLTRLKDLRCLERPSHLRAKCGNHIPANAFAERTPAFPEGRLVSVAAESVQDGKITLVGNDQVIQALSDTPAMRSRLPQQLIGAKVLESVQAILAYPQAIDGG